VVPLEVDTTFKVPASGINVAIAAAGTYNAAPSDVTFSLAKVNDFYLYTIAGFGAGDRIAGPAGPGPSLTHDDLGDGRVAMEYSAAGKLVTIAPTGPSSTDDAALFGAADLNTVLARTPSDRQSHLFHEGANTGAIAAVETARSRLPDALQARGRPVAADPFTLLRARHSFPSEVFDDLV